MGYVNSTVTWKTELDVSVLRQCSSVGVRRATLSDILGTSGLYQEEGGHKVLQIEFSCISLARHASCTAELPLWLFMDFEGFYGKIKSTLIITSNHI